MSELITNRATSTAKVCYGPQHMCVYFSLIIRIEDDLFDTQCIHRGGSNIE